MESHQSVVSPLKNFSVVLAEPERQKPDFVMRNSGNGSGGISVHRKEGMGGNSEGFIGYLEVFIHQARDIQNICIYHKQDVYAKVCLTSHPETTVSTQTVNGGGKNPVFNENLRLNVRTIDSSLKCELWMLSRVKNYLEDQLLGFALVPLSDIVVENGKLAKEFSLSSTDLFHSPAGFVQLSLSYCGDAPEVLAITPRASLTSNKGLQDSEISDSVRSDYDKIEFPDPKIANENHMMVEQYFGIPCTTLDSQTSESLDTSESDMTSRLGVKVVESFSEASPNSIEVTKADTPASSVSTNGSPSESSCDTSGAPKSPNQEQASPLKDQSDSSNGVPSNKFAHSFVGINIEPEQTVVQQDIVDMYMKSMQQFTESLAKMKLPMDIGNGNGNGNANANGSGSGSTDSGNSNASSDQKSQTPKSTGSRVFYGSRAFF